MDIAALITGFGAGFLDFLLNAVVAGGALAVVAGFTYPFWIKIIYPIPFIVIKNAGGAKDTNTIILDKNIIKRGRLKKTDYGQRVSIKGLRGTFPLSLVSRERAIPWEAGGVAFILYEKEVGQYTGVKPEVFNLHLLQAKSKQVNEALNMLYHKIKTEYTELADYVTFSRPEKILAPVTFANESVKIRPFPVDLTTPTMYDMKIRTERIINTPNWQKWAPYAVMGVLVVALIVVTVLSYDQVNKSIDDRLAQLNTGSDQFAQKIADKMSGADVPPEGKAGVFIPFILGWRRRWLS